MSEKSNEKLSFGQYIKEHRDNKGYTQHELADLIGVTPKSISFIERGENFPSPDNMFELARVLDMSLDEFLFGYKKFDSSIRLPQINQNLSQLSPENQALLISIVEATCKTMLIQQQKQSKN